MADATLDSMTVEELDALIAKADATKRAKKVTLPLGSPVVVTTTHRGVFFGYAHDVSGETIRLERSRLCLYWSADVKGFMGLASTGPSKGCRIGPEATITLRNITAVLDATADAVKAWESAPWQK